jgi:hypothetical protein
LIEGFEAGHLIADKRYDSEAIVERAKAQGIPCVTPPRRNRRRLRE